jgi:hypothetical protein
MTDVVGNVPSSVSRVVDRGIDYALVDATPKYLLGAINQRLDEEHSIEFVDVILVHYGVVEAAQASSDSFR